MTELTAASGYAFGNFALYPTERSLLSNGNPVSVSPRAFDVLVALIERAGRLVSKEELLGLVWPNLVVEENNLQAHVSALRKILGHKAITTVLGRGYRFALMPEAVAAELPLSPEPRKHNLPRQLTSFVGRQKEIAEVQALLFGARLLTLTGASGCGKTRLGLQVAADSLEHFPDGTWLVDLAPLADPSLARQAVATVLGMNEDAGKPIARIVAQRLAQKRLLLVLDNCEHLLDTCADVVDALVQQYPGVQVLATSREALGVAGEQTYRVPSLTTPDATDAQTPQGIACCESIRLFVERARLVRPDFRITEQNARPLALLCRRLDGIPLAIELAAARVRMFTVEEINGKLDQSFRILTGGWRTAPLRHQTLRSLVDWSYGLLNAAEKRLLQRLSVFSGGWTLDAAERVCSGEGVTQEDVLELMSSLSDQNLVLPEQADGHSRYRLLETMQQYARQRLAESGGGDAIRSRHRDYFLAFAEEAKAKLSGADRGDWLRRLEAEHHNLQAALEWRSADADPRAASSSLASLAQSIS